MGLSKAIAKEKMTEQHWRVLQVLSDENGRAMGNWPRSPHEPSSADQKH
jgi:hypothetical protein